MTYMTPSATYQRAIDRFFTLLNETAQICKKTCKNQYDQERNHYVSYHPKIEDRKKRQQKSYDKMKNHFSSINQFGNSKENLKQLVRDVNYLVGCPFNNLFMKVLTGKLKKHFLLDHSLMRAIHFHLNPYLGCLSFYEAPGSNDRRPTKPHKNLLEVLDIPNLRCK